MRSPWTENTCANNLEYKSEVIHRLTVYVAPRSKDLLNISITAGASKRMTTLSLSFAVVMPPVASEVAVRGVSSQPV